MDGVDNNQFEVKPNPRNKRKFPDMTSKVYHNPGLDLLTNDDPKCNNAMEVVPFKKRKRSRSCDITTFENSALDLGISKTAVNEFLMKELDNVRKYLKNHDDPTPSKCINEPINTNEAEPIYANLNSSDPCVPLPREMIVEGNRRSVEPKIAAASAKGIDFATTDVAMNSPISVLEQTPMDSSMTFNTDISCIEKVNTTKNIANNIFCNNQSNLSLSFIDRLALESSTISNQSLYLDDDLNESNIMEIKTITIVTKKNSEKNSTVNTNPFLNNSMDDVILDKTNIPLENPFLDPSDQIDKSIDGKFTEDIQCHDNFLVPRKLFASDVNSTISTVNDSVTNYDQNEYENIDSMRAESPIYENIDDTNSNFNKQSKILGHDVSHFNAVDIMNLNKLSTKVNSSNESNETKKTKFFNASKLSKKVLKKIKQTFKTEKPDANITLNPYEVPRKLPKQKTKAKEESGIENPALNLDNSDDLELEELEDEEHQYETVKTLRNTQLNMNLTPLRERINEMSDYSHNRTNTPSKKQVRFDSTLNQEKVITGNSFEYDIQSPGFDAKLEKFHDELENCMNERKFIQQNM